MRSCGSCSRCNYAQEAPASIGHRPRGRCRRPPASAHSRDLRIGSGSGRARRHCELTVSATLLSLGRARRYAASGRKRGTAAEAGGGYERGRSFFRRPAPSGPATDRSSSARQVAADPSRSFRLGLQGSAAHRWRSVVQHVELTFRPHCAHPEASAPLSPTAGLKVLANLSARQHAKTPRQPPASLEGATRAPRWMEARRPTG